MPEANTHSITHGEHTLLVMAASIGEHAIPAYVLPLVTDAFEAIAPYIQQSTQLAYLRDLPNGGIDGLYPGGATYNPSEVVIDVPHWQVPREQLTATVNHEFHHLARWQNAGYGTTLGGAILSEGLATYYEGLASDWRAPWSKVVPTDEELQNATAEWDNPDYNHAEWFFGGQYQRWAGYGIGMLIAQRLYKTEFDLQHSLTVTAQEAKSVLAQGLA